jgi:hypothetical protein
MIWSRQFLKPIGVMQQPAINRSLEGWKELYILS